MNKKQVEEKLKELIRKNSKVCDETILIDNDTDLIRDCAYDSLSIVKLVVDIEDEFECEIDDSMLVADLLSNFGELSQYINRKVEASVE